MYAKMDGNKDFNSRCGKGVKFVRVKHLQTYVVLVSDGVKDNEEEAITLG